MKSIKLATLLVGCAFALSACDVPPPATDTPATPMATQCCDKAGKNCKPAPATGQCMKAKAKAMTKKPATK